MVPCDIQGAKDFASRDFIHENEKVPQYEILFGEMQKNVLLSYNFKIIL